MNIETTYENEYGEEIPVEIIITNYQPYRCGKRGHIDDWLPDEYEEIEFWVKHGDEDITDSIPQDVMEMFEWEALAWVKSDWDDYS